MFHEIFILLLTAINCRVVFGQNSQQLHTATSYDSTTLVSINNNETDKTFITDSDSVSNSIQPTIAVISSSLPEHDRTLLNSSTNTDLINENAKQQPLDSSTQSSHQNSSKTWLIILLVIILSIGCVIICVWCLCRKRNKSEDLEYADESDSDSIRPQTSLKPAQAPEDIEAEMMRPETIEEIKHNRYHTRVQPKTPPDIKPKVNKSDIGSEKRTEPMKPEDNKTRKSGNEEIDDKTETNATASDAENEATPDENQTLRSVNEESDDSETNNTSVNDSSIKTPEELSNENDQTSNSDSENNQKEDTNENQSPEETDNVGIKEDSYENLMYSIDGKKKSIN